MAETILERRIKNVYREAKEDLEKKLNDFADKYRKKNREMLALRDAGKITQAQYQDWLKGQIFQGKQWRSKVEEATTTLLHSNEKALSIIRDEQMVVYADNANRQAYEVEQHIGLDPRTGEVIREDMSFDIYDVSTVDKLIKENPELLPRKVIKGKKDKAWNQDIISNVITHGIIQGESIDEIAERMARDTAQTDFKAMLRYARTAMVGAQNAGRIDTMNRAQEMGIRCQKQWLSTLDTRTRDSHRHLDGQIRDIDKPFDSDLGKIMFPGDPEAEPGDVWNCRCTLVYVYPDYPDENVERRDNESGEVIGNVSYDEWLAAKHPDEAEKEKARKPKKEEESKKPEFIPAKTIEEAEEFAKTFVDTNAWASFGISLKGISLESANIVNKRLSEFYAEYDVEKFSSLVAPAGNTKLGRAIQSGHAAFSPANRAMLLNRTSLKDPKKIQEHLAKEKELVKDYLANPDKYTGLNKMTKKILQASGKSGRATVPTTLEEIIDHECGHALEKAIRKTEQYAEIAKNWHTYGEGISGYAVYDFAEYIAESHCAWKKGENVVDPVLIRAFESIRRR